MECHDIVEVAHIFDATKQVELGWGDIVSVDFSDFLMRNLFLVPSKESRLQQTSLSAGYLESKKQVVMPS